MNRRCLLALLLALTNLASCQSEKPMSEADHNPAPAPKVPEGAETITVAAGCFWCIEGAYRRIDGVISATSGYIGGTKANPTYDDVCTGTTGHAEAVEIVYDPKKITTEKILSWFWDLHDPTTLNRQGADEGTQYRSAIFYHNDEQKKIAEASKKAAQANFSTPIVTEITKAGTFYPAENYHQDYYTQNKSKNPYCRVVIEPKLKKLHLDK
jgi:peptide-methionine (S)-S-oxide reductase